MGKDAPFLRYLEYMAGRTAIRLYTVQFGVWKLAVREKPRSFKPSLPSLEDAKQLLRQFSPTWTFVKDIYRIAPQQFTIYVLHKGWTSLDGGLSLYISGRLMSAVSAQVLITYCWMLS